MNQPILTILILTILKREKILKKLISEFNRQIETLKAEKDVEIIISEADDETVSIGLKRNQLLAKATGEFLCFFDDDDSPSHNYIPHVINACKVGNDCCSLKGEITGYGRGGPEIFEHSLRYKEWFENKEAQHPNVKYLRFPNHLNAIRRVIAQKFKFPEKNHGEDHDWSKKLHRSGLIQTEAYIPEVIYKYNYKARK